MTLTKDEEAEANDEEAEEEEEAEPTDEEAEAEVEAHFACVVCMLSLAASCGCASCVWIGLVRRLYGVFGCVLWLRSLLAFCAFSLASQMHIQKSYSHAWQEA